MRAFRLRARLSCRATMDVSAPGRLRLRAKEPSDKLDYVWITASGVLCLAEGTGASNPPAVNVC